MCLKQVSRCSSSYLWHSIYIKKSLPFGTLQVLRIKRDWPSVKSLVIILIKVGRPAHCGWYHFLDRGSWTVYVGKDSCRHEFFPLCFLTMDTIWPAVAQSWLWIQCDQLLQVLTADAVWAVASGSCHHGFLTMMVSVPLDYEPDKPCVS